MNTLKIKLIILGPQCSGKTTLTGQLSGKFTLPVTEEEQEIKRINHGKIPSGPDYDYHLLFDVQRPMIQQRIARQKTSIIFLTSFFDLNLLKKAKHRGFKVLQLQAAKSVLEQRNKKRVSEGLAPDATVGWDLNLPYHEQLKQTNMIDAIIDTDCDPEEVAEAVIRFSKINFVNQVGQIARPGLYTITNN